MTAQYNKQTTESRSEEIDVIALSIILFNKPGPHDKSRGLRS
jgi:hypothetical protein